jgi:hypothetical protein
MTLARPTSGPAGHTGGAARTDQRRRARPGLQRLLALPLLALVLAGCRLDVDTDVTVDARGAGTIAVSVRIDGATLRELDRLGVDPGIDVDLALGATSAWRSERLVDEDGGLTHVYRRGFADGAELTSVLRELSDGIAVQDPALRFDVVATTTRTGALTLAGQAGLRPPMTTGVLIDDVPVGPSGAPLAQLTTDAVRARLDVRVPGTVVQTDADRVGERVVGWDLPVGELRPITLVSAPAPWWSRVPWTLVGALVAAGALAGFVSARRRAAARVSQDDTGDAGDTAYPQA